MAKTRVGGGASGARGRGCIAGISNEALKCVSAEADDSQASLSTGCTVK